VKSRLVPKAVRPKSVRAKVVAVLMVPVISLMALWAFATVSTAQNVAAQQNFKEVNATLLTPINEFVSAIQDERTVAARHMASGLSEIEALTNAGDRTTAAADALGESIARSSTEAAELDPRLPEHIDMMMMDAQHLAELRQDVAVGDVSLDESFDGYTSAIEHAFHVRGILAAVPVPDDASDPRVVHELANGREMLARANAVMAAAYASGTLSPTQYVEFAGFVQARQAFLQASVHLQPSDAALYEAVLEAPPYEALRGYEQAILAAGPGEDFLTAAPVSGWNDASAAVLNDLAGAETAITTLAAEESNVFGLDVLGASGLAVALGLVGVILSLVISVHIGRGLLVELIGLRNSAMDLAARKLPATLRRLHAGEKVELEDEAPRTFHGDDEVSQVAESLNAVHRAAINAAIERSEVLSGISGVYVYLARRSQVLLHRQLALLDAMERRTENPEDLEDLFKLDHLTTRMRRQAESLIILSGAHPARRWRNPVPIVDVVRAAVAEVEDFTRVDVHEFPELRLSGAAVADLTHLIAELVENAVSFSPPHTKALVRGEVVGAGLVIEIEDRGLGMSRQAMEDANRRINDAEQVDLLEADQLGLFVVNRLAHRQNVKVTLQRSPYGGVTAIVLVPEELLDSRKTNEPAGVRLAASNDVPAPALHTARRLTTAPPLKPSVPQEPAASNGSLRTSPWQVITPETTPDAAPPPFVPQQPEVPAMDDAPAAWEQLPNEQLAEPVPLSAVRTPEPPPEPQPEQHGPRQGQQDTEGLPRRVRQASLAPELRDSPTPAADPPTPIAEGRTPEQARATLSALRTGWLRGQTAAGEGDSPGGDGE
jgi:signal transduction histidine kinase